MLEVAAASDAPAALALHDAAATWMLARGVRQWRPGDRPPAYFAAAAEAGRLLVWRAGGAVLGAAVVAETDPAWESTPPGTRYVHTLVTDRAHPGLGRRVLAALEAHLRAAGVTRVRLDCVATNGALRAYYREAGYTEVGTRGRLALFERALWPARVVSPEDRRMVFLAAAARLPVADLDRAREWYARVLGLSPAEQRPGGLRYDLGGTEFALYTSAGRSDGSFTQLALYVDDLPATVAALRERGVAVEDYDLPGLATTGGIAEIDGNYPSKGTGERAAWVRDPDGNLIGLAQPVP